MNNIFIFVLSIIFGSPPAHYSNWGSSTKKSLFSNILGLKTQRKSWWKSNKSIGIIRFLTAENSKDILTGLSKADSVSWDKIKNQILILMYHPNPKISSKALYLAVQNKEPMASSLVRQKIAFAMDSKKRIKAIKLLAFLNNPDDYSFFIRLLRYQNMEIRLIIIKLIGNLQIKQGLHKLIGLLGDSREKIRIEVVKTLSSFGGKKVLIPLISKLSDLSSSVRMEAIKGLSKIKNIHSKNALLRLLRTGTKKEQLQILEFFPYSEKTKTHLIFILKNGSITEQMKVLSLINGNIDDQLLKLLVKIGISNYKIQAKLNVIANKRLKIKSLTFVRKIIFSAKIPVNLRKFLAQLTASSSLPGSINIIKKLNNLNLIKSEEMISIVGKSNNAKSLSLLREIYLKGDLKQKSKIISIFITRKDDRFVKLFLKSFSKNSKLFPTLLAYAKSTRSLLFVPQLFKMLKSDNEKISHGEILVILHKIGIESSYDKIIALGPVINQDELSTWSNILIEKLNSKRISKLQNIPLSNNKLKKELYFLLSKASLNSLKISSKFKKFNDITTKNYYKLWLWSSLLKSKKITIPQKFKNEIIPTLFDLLNEDLMINNWKKYYNLKNSEINRSLAKFKLPHKILIKLLNSNDLCTKINAIRGLKSFIYKNPSAAFDIYEKESNGYIRFNILFYLKFQKTLISDANSLFNMKFKITKSQWIGLLKKWPRKDAKKLAKKWGYKNIAWNNKIKKNNIIRFVFHFKPLNLKCMITGSSENGFSAVNPPISKDLVLLNLKSNSITISPEYK
jgi:HEAT repeats